MGKSPRHVPNTFMGHSHQFRTWFITFSLGHLTLIGERGPHSSAGNQEQGIKWIIKFTCRYSSSLHLGLSEKKLFALQIDEEELEGAKKDS